MAQKRRSLSSRAAEGRGFPAFAAVRLALVLATGALLGGCMTTGSEMTASVTGASVCPSLALEKPETCTTPDTAANTEPSVIFDRALGIDAPDAGPVATERTRAIRDTSKAAMAGQADKAAPPSESPPAKAPAKAVRPAAAGSLNRLPDAVAHAVLGNPEVRVVEARVEEARAGIRIAEAGLKPVVEGSVANGPNYSGNFSGTSLPYTNAAGRNNGRLDAGLSLRQLVFDFGATQSDVDRAAFLRDSERHKLREKIDEIAFKTAQTYTRILELRAIEGLVRETLGAHQKLLEIVEAQAREGHGTIADVNRIKSRLVDVTTIQTDVSLQRLGAEDQFERLTRHRPGALGPMPGLRHALPRDAGAAIALALSRNPKLASMAAARNSVEKELEYQKASVLPRVSLEASSDSKNYYTARAGRSEVELKTMLAVRFKIFDGGLGQATEDQINARLKGNEMGYLNERELMEADLRQSYRAISSAEQKQRLLGAGVRTAQSVRELYLEQFKGGKRTIFELLDSQMALYTARRSQIEAQYDAARAVYDVLRNTGELTRVLANADAPLPKRTASVKRP